MHARVRDQGVRVRRGHPLHRQHGGQQHEPRLRRLPHRRAPPVAADRRRVRPRGVRRGRGRDEVVRSVQGKGGVQEEAEGAVSEGGRGDRQVFRAHAEGQGGRSGLHDSQGEFAVELQFSVFLFYHQVVLVPRFVIKLFEKNEHI